MQAKGYGLAHIAKLLSDNAITVTEVTLKHYIHRLSTQTIAESSRKGVRADLPDDAAYRRSDPERARWSRIMLHLPPRGASDRSPQWMRRRTIHPGPVPLRGVALSSPHDRNRRLPRQRVEWADPGSWSGRTPRTSRRRGRRPRRAGRVVGPSWRRAKAADVAPGGATLQRPSPLRGEREVAGNEPIASRYPRANEQRKEKGR